MCLETNVTLNFFLLLFLGKVNDLIGGGFVINWATPSSLWYSTLYLAKFGDLSLGPANNNNNNISCWIRIDSIKHVCVMKGVEMAKERLISMWLHLLFQTYLKVPSCNIFFS